jgi:catechol 2,3-dioxygenase-like lactoylglutathione lyase family enzyme
MAGIARLQLTALDCADPRGVAEFYARLTGWEIIEDSGDWVELGNPDGGPTIACQRAPDHRPPVWPGADHPQQLHLDFEVDDLDAGEAAALAIGARKAEFQPGTTFRVFLDPAGHPFCLCRTAA